jgi:glycosyltransferase involved in cell wall biosynthesis
MAVSKKHKITVFHIVSDSNCKKNIEIISLDKEGVQTYIAYIKQTNNRLLKAYYFMLAFFKLLGKESNFDLVHLNEFYPFGVFSLYLKWFKRIPFVISEHWTGYITQEKIPWTQRKLSKLILKHASIICPVSEDLQKNIFKKIGVKIPCKVVPNVVNTEIFFPTNTKNQVFTILHISNMKDDHKNVSGILKSVQLFSEKYSNFKLILLGENSISYKKKAKELNLEANIEFINHIPHEEVPKILQKSDVFLLFSNYENLPCVILESFSSGIPVISTNVGGISEFFPKGFGKLIDVNNQKELLESLLYYQKYKTTQKQKEIMHKYVQEHFSETHICHLFNTVYQNVLSN